MYLTAKGKSCEHNIIILTRLLCSSIILHENGNTFYLKFCIRIILTVYTLWIISTYNTYYRYIMYTQFRELNTRCIIIYYNRWWFVQTPSFAWWYLILA